jgi:hypothetical protein
VPPDETFKGVFFTGREACFLYEKLAEFLKDVRLPRLF